MKKQLSRKTLRNKADRLWSAAVRKEAGHKCQNPKCKTSGMRVDAHHIISRNIYNLRYELVNGLCLCVVCHHKAGTNPIFHNRLIKEHRTAEEIEYLAAEAVKLVKITPDWYQGHIERLKARLEELDSQDGGDFE